MSFRAYRASVPETSAKSDVGYGEIRRARNLRVVRKASGVPADTAFVPRARSAGTSAPETERFSRAQKISGSVMTVGEALANGRAVLTSFGNEGRFDALRLLEEIIGRNAAWIFANDDATIDPAAFDRYERGLARRRTGEPLAYISGSVGFFGRTFGVTRAVLVPRPETEMIVELAREQLRDRGLAIPRICDVGTGSGILAITLASELPTAEVTAIDISADALDVARANARTLGVDERMRFAHGDLFAALANSLAFDCIVANLPYIRSDDLAPPPPSIAHEPMLALDGGPDGLDEYRRFLADAPARLAPGGIALLEAGADTTLALAELAAQAFGAGSCVHVHHDYAGHPRIVDVRT